MLSIPHALTGAFIASKIPYPIVYVPLTIGMHYLQDWIPHWDVGTGLSTGKRKRSTAVLLELIDLTVTIALIYYFFKDVNPSLTPHIWLGALMGIAPDLVEAPRNFLNWEPRFIKPFNEIHGSFHHSTHSRIIGVIPQVIVVGLVFLLI